MDIMSVNWILLCVLALAIINIISGYKNGLVKEIINFVSMLVLSVLIVLLSSVLKSYTDKQYIQMITMIIMVLILLLAHRLLKVALDGMKLLAKLPVVSFVNKLAGAVFALCLFGMFDLGTVGEYINMYIGESQILTYLYENNLIAILGEKILGPDFQMKALDLLLEQGKEIVTEIM